MSITEYPHTSQTTITPPPTTMARSIHTRTVHTRRRRYERDRGRRWEAGWPHCPCHLPSHAMCHACSFQAPLFLGGVVVCVMPRLAQPASRQACKFLATTHPCPGLFECRVSLLLPAQPAKCRCVCKCVPARPHAMRCRSECLTPPHHRHHTSPSSRGEGVDSEMPKSHAGRRC